MSSAAWDLGDTAGWLSWDLAGLWSQSERPSQQVLSLCRPPPTPPHPCQPSVSTVLRPLRLLSSPRSARTACLMPPRAQGWGEERSLSHLWLGSGHWRWTVNLLKNRDSFPELLEPRSAPQPPSRMRTSVLCASMVGSCCAVTAAPKCITFPAMCQPCSASRGESCHHLASGVIFRARS